VQLTANKFTFSGQSDLHRSLNLTADFLDVQRLTREMLEQEVSDYLGRDHYERRDETAAILFYTERPAYEISELVAGIPLDTYCPFGANLTNVEEKVFREQGAALVLFDSVYWQFWQLYEQDTQRRLDEFISGLYLYYDGWDGKIYFIDRPGF
jgi:hypothetical protein